MSIETTTGMSPPPIDATRCQPSTRARTVAEMISHSVGLMTNQTVIATKSTRAPMLRAFFPGSIIGLESIFPASFR